jgi:SAGA-associated factor 29
VFVKFCYTSLANYHIGHRILPVLPLTHNAAPSVKEIDELQGLYRENVRHAAEEHKMLREEPADLIKNLGILRALRTASENEPVRTTAPSKSRKPKAHKIEVDGAADSPGPSPGLSSGPSTNATRLKGSSARSGSVASTRESRADNKSDKDVKMEDADGVKGTNVERASKLFRGVEVAYKQTKMKEDGSQWIQCTIVHVMEIGNKKR